MAELISKERARHEFALFFQDSKSLVEDCDSLLCMLPTIEAEPVKHGEWVSRFARHWKGRDQCSECGFHEKDHRDLSHYNYCPNCGARMT